MAFLTDLSDVLLFAASIEKIVSIVWVALGLGLVIFFHELGHFAVAKWCNVHVERFSIGFGPILWSRKWGETEYALSAIPFGGYVKMLGQDDLDPSQLSSEDIARDPRSYSAKSVPQRMAIISAGVIMNILTAMIFFGLAFGIGIDQEPPVLGELSVGKPAWVAGMRQGDRLTSINGRDIESFGDITRGVALSSGSITIDGVHPDGETFSVTFAPDVSGTRRVIGVSPTASLKLLDAPDKTFPPTLPGTPGAKAEPPFEAGDEIRKVGGENVKSFAQLQSLLARRASETLEFEVARGRGEQRRIEKIQVGPNPFRTLGLVMDIGKVMTIQDGSPAAGKMQIDDKITRVNDEEVGTDFNPLELPDKLWKLRGQEVTLMVLRAVKGSESKEIPIKITPIDRPGWIEHPNAPGVPLSIPSIGVGFHIGRTVLRVEPGSPAEAGKIANGDRIKMVELIRQASAPKDQFPDDVIQIPFPQKTDDGKVKETNWAYAFWLIQSAPTRSIKITLGGVEGASRDVTIAPAENPEGEWFSPFRGLALQPDRQKLEAKSLGHAMSLGMIHTRNTIVDIYLTLRSLLTGNVSPKELHGPVMIAKVAYYAANEGIAELMLFLGLLSVNLAVINFLPIPVLDGGHMVFLIWEAVTRRKPSERVLIAAQYFGMAFVLSLMLAVLYLDLFVHSRTP